MAYRSVSPNAKEQEEFVNSAKSIGFQPIDETSELAFSPNYSTDLHDKNAERQKKLAREKKIAEASKQAQAEEMKTTSPPNTKASPVSVEGQQQVLEELSLSQSSASPPVSPSSTSAQASSASVSTAVGLSDDMSVLDEVLQLIFQKLDSDGNGTLEKREVFKALLDGDAVSSTLESFPMLRPLLKPQHFESTFLQLENASTSATHKVGLKDFTSFAKEVLQPYANMYVHVVGANGLRKADGMFGKSDPYAKVYFNNTLCGKTKVVSKNLNPVFQEVFRAPFALDTGKSSWQEMTVRIELWDEDHGDESKHDFLGELRFTGTRLHELLEKTSPADYKLCARDPQKYKSTPKPSGTCTVHVSLGEPLHSFHAPGQCSSVKPAQSSDSKVSDHSEALALKATLKKLSAQLARVKREKNLAADLLDKRASEHEVELEEQRKKYVALELQHQNDAKQKQHQIDELIESNLELATQLKALDDKLKETTEIALAMDEENMTLRKQSGIGSEDDLDITFSESDAALSERVANSDKGSPISSPESSGKPFSFNPLTFPNTDGQFQQNNLDEILPESEGNSPKESEHIFNNFNFEEESGNFKSMALTDLMELGNGPRKVYMVASKDGFVPGVFWNGLCARHGKSIFIDFPSLLKMEIVRGSRLGTEILKHTSFGRAVPATILADIAVSNAIKPEKHQTKEDVVMFGFPNTLSEHIALKQALNGEVLKMIYVDITGQEQSLFSQNESQLNVGPLKAFKDELEREGHVHTYRMASTELKDKRSLILLQNFFINCINGSVPSTPAETVSQHGDEEEEERENTPTDYHVSQTLPTPTLKSPSAFSRGNTSTLYGALASVGDVSPMQLTGQQHARNMVRFQMPEQQLGMSPNSPLAGAVRAQQSMGGYSDGSQPQQTRLGQMMQHQPAWQAQKDQRYKAIPSLSPLVASPKRSNQPKGVKLHGSAKLSGSVNQPPPPPPEPTSPLEKPMKLLTSSLEDRAVELIRWLKTEQSLPRKKDLERKPLLVNWRRYFSNGYVIGKLVEACHKENGIVAVKALKILDDGSSLDIKHSNWDILLKYFKKRACNFPMEEEERKQIIEGKRVEVVLTVVTRLYYYVFSRKTNVKPRLDPSIIGEDPIPRLLAEAKAENGGGEATLPQWKRQQLMQHQAEQNAAQMDAQQNQFNQGYNYNNNMVMAGGVPYQQSQGGTGGSMMMPSHGSPMRYGQTHNRQQQMGGGVGISHNMQAMQYQQNRQKMVRFAQR